MGRRTVVLNLPARPDKSRTGRPLGVVEFMSRHTSLAHRRRRLSSSMPLLTACVIAAPSPSLSYLPLLSLILSYLILSLLSTYLSMYLSIYVSYPTVSYLILSLAVLGRGVKDGTSHLQRHRHARRVSGRAAARAGPKSPDVVWSQEVEEECRRSAGALMEP